MEHMKIKYGNKNIYFLLGYTTSHDIKTFPKIHIKVYQNRMKPLWIKRVDLKHF